MNLMQVAELMLVDVLIAVGLVVLAYYLWLLADCWNTREARKAWIKKYMEKYAQQMLDRGELVIREKEKKE